MFYKRSFFLFILVSLSISQVFSDHNKIAIIIQKENTATYIETLSGLTSHLSRTDVDRDIIIKNAKNDKEAIRRYAREFSQDSHVDIIIVMGSSAVTIVNEVVKNKPVLFGGINHPDGLGVKGSNITGATYYIQPLSLVKLIKQIKPDARKIGMLYISPELNAASKVEVPEFEKSSRAMNYDFVKEEVRKENEITAKTRSLIRNGAQVLVIPTNATLYNNIDIIRKETDKAGIPIVSFSMKGVTNGALIGLTSDNTELGKELGKMVYDIITHKKNPSDIPYKFPDNYKIVINIKAMSDLNISVPFSILKIAVKIE